MSEGLVQWEITAPYDLKDRTHHVDDCIDVTLTVKRGSHTAQAVQQLLATENYGVDNALLGCEF